ncbi:MAG: HD family phosphohydrolase [Planctomycetota bacterium]
MLITSIFTAVLVILLGFGNPPLPYRRGQVAKADIRARVNFRVVDEDATRMAREKAAAASPNVYRVDISSCERALATLKDALATVGEAESFAAVDATKAGSLAMTEDFFTAVKGTEVSGEAIAAAASQAVSALVKRGVLPEADAQQERTTGRTGGIAIAEGEQVSYRKLSDLVAQADIPSALKTGLRDSLGPGELTDTVASYLASFVKPFLFYDDEETKKRRKAVEAEVAEVEVSYYRGDTLVRRDTVIDNIPHLRRLRKEHETYLAGLSGRDRILRLVGLAVTVSLILTLFAYYASVYDPRVLARTVRILVLMGLAVLLAAVTRFFVRSSFSWYLIPLPLFAMAVAIAYDRIFALGYTLALAVIIGIATGSNFALSLSLFMGAAAGITTLGRVVSRPRPFIAGLASGLGIFVATWGTGLLFHTDYSLTFDDSLLGFVNGAACGALLTVILPFIERGFNVVTDLSLLELADLNKPLLRRLALEAAGTYSHSLSVGNLADAAAEVVGANRLFARVGGYYHDIGKLIKPDYFVENRGNAASRHHNLSPTMSALVIISHVKDGAELGRENGLPSALVDLIREHHGTTLVEYFYREARDKAKDSSEIRDESFRYPGPRPRSKEAAIVMLCDGVESASRTIEDPTPSRLEGLVVDIVRRKLGDGQFDECGITMADLRRVEVSLTKSLAGIFHSRIKYPGREL